MLAMLEGEEAADETPESTANETTEPTEPALTEDELMALIKTEYPNDPTLQAIIQAKKEGLRRLPFKLLHGAEQMRLELGDCSLNNNLLYVNNKLYIPAGEARTRVIDQAYRSVCGGHSGKHGCYSKLTRWYFWPRKTTDVAQYVRNCLICKRSQSYRDGKHGLLHPLPILEPYWSSI
jgi:hypothetical protein